MFSGVLPTVLLLVASNVFMTFAWYAHLRNLADRPWYVAAVISWSIALCEYLLQVPANRLGYTVLSLPQLKILQEVITLAVFCVFSVLYLREALKWNHLVGFGLVLAAVLWWLQEKTRIGAMIRAGMDNKQMTMDILSPVRHNLMPSITQMFILLKRIRMVL